MYEIYSIGDGAYLTAVLNAVAMLSGSGDMQQLAGVGFLMGILLVMGQGILQAKFPPLQNVLFAWVLYMAMFGPTARVQVEDLYSGATRHVDNVPLGVAFVGSAMSKVGYGVTVLFEQAFSTPAMTEYGFAAPLQILQDTRKGTWSSVAQGAANAPTPGADMERSWSAYIAGCVLWNVDTGRVARDTIVRDPSWPSAFDPHGLVVPTVQLWLGGAPVTKDCRAAWADLRDYTTTAYTPALRRSLAATLRIEEGNVDGTIQAALDALAGMGSDAQDYMVMAALLPFWTKGKADVYRELGKYNDAVMVEQAAQQRNTQWAAEERLFSKIVRPMMTFFEAFLFAISPLMMFAIGLGPVGIRMVGKYLMFALWIQLWKPILAVINLYIIMAVQGKLDALQAVGTGDTPMPSLLALWKLDLILADYLGTGGMLAASTPAISLMLIYGSAITATHLAGRLQGGDHINEKIASPDVLQPAPALAMGPLQAHTRLSGSVTPDAHQVLPSINLASSTEQSVRSAQTEQAQSMEAFRSALSNAAIKTAGTSSSSGSGGSRAWNVSAGTSEVDKFIHQRAETIRQELGLAESSRDSIASAYSAGLHVGAKGGSQEDVRGAARQSMKLPLKGGGELSGDHEVESRTADTLSDTIARQVTADLTRDVELATRMSMDTRASHENQFTQGLSDKDESQLERTSTDVVTATRAFERAQATRDQHGVSASYRADHLGQALVSHPALMAGARQEFMQRFGYLNGDLGRVSDKYKHVLGPDKAEAFGMISLLVGHDKPTIARMSQEEQQAAAEFGYGLIAKAMGGAPVTGVNPYAAQGLENKAPASGGTRATVEGAGLRDPRGESTDISGQAAAHYRTAQTLVQDAHGEVHQRYATGRDNLVLDQVKQRAQFNEGRREALAQQIHEQAQLPGSLPRWTVEQVGGLFKMVSDQAGLADIGLSGAVQRFGQSLADGNGLIDAAQAAGSGWAHARQEVVDTRMQQVRGSGERQLTDAQMAVYRIAIESALPDVDGLHRTLDTDLNQARQRLIQEEGPIGEHMANILVNAAVSQQDIGLAPIRAYNQAETSQEKLRAEIEVLQKKTVEPRFGGRGGPLEAPEHIQGHLRDLEASYGLPTGLLTAIAHTESRFNPAAVSHAGAQGMFQLMPETARSLGVKDPFDPYQGAVGAAKHLAQSYRQFDNWDHAIMAYNAGDTRIRNYLAGEGPTLKQETINYLPKVAGALRRVNTG